VPGVLLITVDTLRADHVGLYGEERGLTPNIDAFFADGLRYTTAYAHSGWTKPSVATLMTAQLPVEHGVVQWQDVLSPALPTLGSALRRAGWRTEAVVAHSAVDETSGLQHGFEAFDTSAFASRGYPGDFLTSAELTAAALPRLASLMADETPWLLWLHYFDPHNDYFDHDDVLDLGTDEIARYAEEVAFTDHHIGRVLAEVSGRQGVTVALVGDHGEELNEHGAIGHSQALYEQLVRVPLLVRSTGLRGAVIDAPVGLIDLAPTLLERVDVPFPESFRGVSLLPVPVARPVVMERSNNGNWRGLVDGTSKLMWDVAQQKSALFDLAADPLERSNLLGVQPEEAQRMLDLLRETYPELPAQLP